MDDLSRHESGVASDSPRPEAAYDQVPESPAMPYDPASGSPVAAYDPATGPPAALVPAPELETDVETPAPQARAPIRTSRAKVGPPSLYGLAPAELAEHLQSVGWERFRAKQLLDWVYHKRVRDPQAMTNLARPLRESVAEVVDLTLPRVQRALESPKRDAFKFGLDLGDGARVESVAMLSRRGVTLCLSTQAGCGMACVFCATGTLGLKRNLRAEEIVAQVVLMLERTGWDDPGYNLVFMGMGEPLANYAATVKAIRILNASEGLAVGARRITLSTCGLVPQIHRLAKEGMPLGLAISLHATTDALRDRLVPINRRYPLRELVRGARYYAETTGRRVTLEYVLLAGVNDSRNDAERLAELARTLPCKINLIPYNPVPQLPWHRPTDEAIQRFADHLFPRYPAVTLRWSQGGEIWAACGQLGSKA
jgi:23S rRNA (adenine2503-C2)-methyltransferase